MLTWLAKMSYYLILGLPADLFRAVFGTYEEVSIT